MNRGRWGCKEARASRAGVMLARGLNRSPIDAAVGREGVRAPSPGPAAGGSLPTPCSLEAAKRQCSSSLDNDCDGAPDDTIDTVCQCAPGAIKVCERQAQGCRVGTQSCVLAMDGASSS